jgi:hypothetical protein
VDLDLPATTMAETICFNFKNVDALLFILFVGLACNELQLVEPGGEILVDGVCDVTVVITVLAS